MNDFGAPSAPPIVLESDHRRAEWNGDHPIRLNDGQTWYLPRVDLVALATIPGLTTDVNHLLDLADGVMKTEEGTPEREVASMRHTAQSVLLARRLLAANYLWPDPPERLFDAEPAGDFFPVSLLSNPLFGYLPIVIAVGQAVGKTAQETTVYLTADRLGIRRANCDLYIPN